MCEQDEPPMYSTHVPPLATLPYLTCAFDEVGQQWHYVDSPSMERVHPLDRVLTYADCRLMDYPKMGDYIDGIVKSDGEQVNTYIDACMAVKERWPKSMAPITLREYYLGSISK